MLLEVQKWNRLKRLRSKLDIAEAVNHAMVGSQADKLKRNARMYAQWQRKIEWEIAQLTGVQRRTVWEALRKRSNKFGR